MAVLAYKLPLVYCILNTLAYIIFSFSVATVLRGLLFLLYRLFDKRRT